MSPQITCPHCGSTINLENRKEVDFEKIMYALHKSPKTFTELLAITNLPRKTLSLRLKDLCISGSIVKDGGYHLNSSIKPTNRIFGRRNGKGKMNRTMLNIGKNVQWIPVALIICLVVVAFGSAMMLSPPSSQPRSPTASFYYAPSSNIVAGRTALSFDAALSSGANGPITSYCWDFGDGSPLNYDKIVTHTYGAEGTYTVTLQVAVNGLMSSTQETLYVSPAPLPPTTPIKFTITPDPTMTNSTGWENQWIVTKSLTFDASAFNEVSGSACNYSWNFGDETIGTGTVVSHAYEQEGNYSVTLTVTNQSAVQQITEQVEILPMPAASIYVNPLPSQYSIGDTITLDIMISNVTDLFGWQTGLTFNSAVLQCLSTTVPSNTIVNGTKTTTVLTEGNFLKRGGNTLWIPEVAENGVIFAHACFLLNSPSSPAKPVSGSGTLATVTFKVIGDGALNIHLVNVLLLDIQDNDIPVFIAT